MFFPLKGHIIVVLTQKYPRLAFDIPETFMEYCAIIKSFIHRIYQLRQTSTD